MGKISVEIQSCYADAEIKGTASKRFVGGLVGWTGGTTTIGQQLCSCGYGR